MIEVLKLYEVFHMSVICCVRAETSFECPQRLHSLDSAYVPDQGVFCL